MDVPSSTGIEWGSKKVEGPIENNRKKGISPQRPVFRLHFEQIYSHQPICVAAGPSVLIRSSICLFCDKTTKKRSKLWSVGDVSVFVRTDFKIRSVRSPHTKFDVLVPSQCRGTPNDNHVGTVRLPKSRSLLRDGAATAHLFPVSPAADAGLFPPQVNWFLNSQVLVCSFHLTQSFCG